MSDGREKDQTDATPPRLECYVLCVDDDRDFLKSVEFFLPDQIGGVGRDVAYRFLFFNDPIEAVAALEELLGEGATVAMVISDEKMPKMKGTELLARTRRLSPDSIRVLLTGHAGIDSAIPAINEHLLDKYLTKPIENEHDFSLSVRHLLERFHMHGRIETQDKVLHELFEFANMLNAMDGVEGTLDYIAAFIKRALDCRQVCFLSNADGLRRAGSESAAAELVCSQWSFPGGAEARRLIGSSKARVADSLASVPGAQLDDARAAAPELQGRVAYVPLTSGRYCMGVLCAIGHGGSDDFSQAERDTLTYIGSSASVALHNQLNRVWLDEAYAETKAYAITLARSNTRMQMLDRLKSDCLAFVLHELRTPLNYRYAVQRMERCEDAAERSRLLSMIREGYERLEQFLAKGLEYLQWFSEPLPGPAATDARDVARAVAGEFESKAAELELSVPDQPCLARISRSTLEEITRTLLHRAVKFTEERPARVRLAIEGAPDRVTLAVADHGHGFPPEQAVDQFRPFTVLDPARPSETTTLSLAKIAAMIEAHGGTIRAHSAGVGLGATFTVELPTQSGHSHAILPGGEPSAESNPFRRSHPDQRAA
jgi:signal transduction histidine kinase/FixJ family two-component response regulator